MFRPLGDNGLVLELRELLAEPPELGFGAQALLVRLRHLSPGRCAD